MMPGSIIEAYCSINGVASIPFLALLGQSGLTGCHIHSNVEFVNSQLKHF